MVGITAGDKAQLKPCILTPDWSWTQPPTVWRQVIYSDEDEDFDTGYGRRGQERGEVTLERESPSAAAGENSSPFATEIAQYHRSRRRLCLFTPNKAKAS